VTQVWTKLGPISARVSQAQTDAAPSVAPSAAGGGVPLSNVSAIVPVVRAPGGQTFTGVGSLLGYFWLDSLSRWVRAPRADLDLSDCGGLSEVALQSLPVSAPVGWFFWVASGVGLSGGGGNVELDCWCSVRVDYSSRLA
jgi:hypothetical protein